MNGSFLERNFSYLFLTSFRCFVCLPRTYMYMSSNICVFDWIFVVRVVFYRIGANGIWMNLMTTVDIENPSVRFHFEWQANNDDRKTPISRIVSPMPTYTQR